MSRSIYRFYGVQGGKIHILVKEVKINKVTTRQQQH
jgi:ABC-type transport system involved in Fe-S cluster assembly fused permease/ATPase subunit